MRVRVKINENYALQQKQYAWMSIENYKNLCRNCANGGDSLKKKQIGAKISDLK